MMCGADAEGVHELVVCCPFRRCRAVFHDRLADGLDFFLQSFRAGHAVADRVGDVLADVDPARRMASSRSGCTLQMVCDTSLTSATSRPARSPPIARFGCTTSLRNFSE